MALKVYSGNMRPILPVLILSAAAVLLQGQTIVEYGATAGSSAGAAAGVGKSIRGVFGQMNKPLAGAAKADEAAKASSSAPAPTVQASAPATPATPALP